VESSAGLDARTILKSGVRERPDVSALAGLDRNKLAVLVWHYHDDDVPGPDAQVDLALENLPPANGTAKLVRYRIDADHSNSYEAWKRMGSPVSPSAEQHRQLEEAGQLGEFGRPQITRVENGKANVRMDLPRQAVSLLVLTWN
jgi:xylan 1,4-beta-xylosidase